MLTGLELMFMGVTRSNSCLSALWFLLSHLWEKENAGVGGEENEKKGRKEKGNRKGKEGRKRE